MNLMIFNELVYTKRLTLFDETIDKYFCLIADGRFSVSDGRVGSSPSKRCPTKRSQIAAQQRRP